MHTFSFDLDPNHTTNHHTQLLPYLLSMHIRIYYVYTQTCNTYVHTYIHIPMYVDEYCTYVCIYVNTYIQTHTYVRTYIHTYIHTYTHAYLHTYLRTYIHKYIHTYIHTYMHTYLHTYIHTCIHRYIFALHTISTYVHPVHVHSHLTTREAPIVPLPGPALLTAVTPYTPLLLRLTSEITN